MTYLKAYRQKLDRLQTKLEEAAPKRHENLLLRKRMVEQAYAQQMKIERNQIASRMDHLTPGPKKVFLHMRLQKLKEQLGR